MKEKTRLLYGTYEQEFLDDSIEEAIERINHGIKICNTDGYDINFRR